MHIRNMIEVVTLVLSSDHFGGGIPEIVRVNPGYNIQVTRSMEMGFGGIYLLPLAYLTYNEMIVKIIRRWHGFTKAITRPAGNTTYL